MFTQTVTDEKLKQVLLEVLADSSSRMILDVIIDVPKSMLEISKETQVPLRTVYRKVQLMHDSKLLKISGAITESGKKHFLYKSMIHSIITSYHSRILTVDITKN